MKHRELQTTPMFIRSQKKKINVRHQARLVSLTGPLTLYAKPHISSDVEKNLVLFTLKLVCCTCRKLKLKLSWKCVDNWLPSACKSGFKLSFETCIVSITSLFGLNNKNNKLEFVSACLSLDKVTRWTIGHVIFNPRAIILFNLLNCFRLSSGFNTWLAFSHLTHFRELLSSSLEQLLRREKKNVAKIISLMFTSLINSYNTVMWSRKSTCRPIKLVTSISILNLLRSHRACPYKARLSLKHKSRVVECTDRACNLLYL